MTSRGGCSRTPTSSTPAQLRCWRIASPTWLAVAGEQLDAVDRVERPVALFVMPAARGEGWQLTPVLSLDAIRLFVSLGGRLERDLRSAVAPRRRRERADRADQRAHAARRAEGVP